MWMNDAIESPSSNFNVPPSDPSKFNTAPKTQNVFIYSDLIPWDSNLILTPAEKFNIEANKIFEELDIDQKGSKKKVLRCLLCKKIYASRGSSTTTAHWLLHNGNLRPYACNVESCSMKYRSVKHLNEHMRKVHKQDQSTLSGLNRTSHSDETALKVHSLKKLGVSSRSISKSLNIKSGSIGRLLTRAKKMLEAPSSQDKLLPSEQIKSHSLSPSISISADEFPDPFSPEVYWYLENVLSSNAPENNVFEEGDQNSPNRVKYSRLI